MGEYAANQFLANSRGTGISIVDVVPSRHLALPQPKTESDTIDTLHTCNARGCGNAQAKGISAVYTNICTYENIPLYGDHYPTAGREIMFEKCLDNLP